VSVRKARDIKSALLQKGFREHPGDHHYYYLYAANKKTSVYTKISRNATDLEDNLQGEMAKQIKLKRPDFNRLIDCSLSGDTYLEMLINVGHVTL
jgi:hypothetical protein